MPRATTKKLKSRGNTTKKNEHAAQATKASGPGSARRPPLRGRLQSFLDMPLDVINEVLSHLEPIDLLHLARTTKMLRAMLMDRRNSSLWKAARANITGAPQCPELTAEPAYANVIFNQRCNTCGKARTKNILWDLKARYCKSCEEHLIRSSSRWYGGSSSDGTLLEVLKPLQLEQSVQMCKIYDVCQVAHARLSTDPYRSGAHSILDSTVDKLKAKLETLTLAERTAYISQQMAANTQWREAVPSLELYMSQRSQARIDELAEIREARYDSIVQRLTDLGWGPELQTMPFMDQHRLRKLQVFAESKPLTERAWEKGLPSLEALMGDFRIGRLARERQIILQDRLTLFAQVLKRAYKDGEGKPSPLDVAIHMPAVHTAIEVPSDVIVDERDLSALCDSGAVSAFAARWREEKVARLRVILEANAGALDPDVEATSLAVGRFICRLCSEELLSSQVLSHWCPESHDHRLCEMSFLPDGYRLAAMRAFVNSPRSMLEYMVPFHVAETSHVLQLCGYDPRSVTLDTMDNSPVRLGCNNCGPDFAPMTWAAALLQEHFELGCTISHFYVLPEKHAKAAGSSSSAAYYDL